MEGAYCADDLPVTDQNYLILHWLLKITVLGVAETVVRLRVKSWFADGGPGTSDSILDLLSLFCFVVFVFLNLIEDIFIGF